MKPDPENDALPADVEAFFEAERARPPLAPEAVRALREATEAALAASAPVATPGPTGGGLGGAAVGLLVGVVLGAVGATALRPAASPTVRPDVTHHATPTASPVAPPAVAPPAVAPPVAARPVVTPRPPSAPGDALAREQLLLQRCRSALLRGDAATALEAVQLHAHQFRAGVLVEEREALRIEALAHLHRVDEARARAADFHRRWPGSLFSDLVDRATADAAPGGP